MTRAEATRKVRMTPEYHYDGVYSHTETNIYDIIDQIYNDHETQLKAKDEEIERLRTQMTGWSMMFDEPQDAKARSIVAMLFWEWRKSIRESGDNTFYNDEFDDGNYWFVNAKEQSFRQAYKMLKDNK